MVLTLFIILPQVLEEFDNKVRCMYRHVNGSPYTTTFSGSTTFSSPTTTNTFVSTCQISIGSCHCTTWGHNPPSDGNIVGWLIEPPLFNLNIMGMPKLMVVIHGWPFQMLEKAIPCHERCKKLWIINLLHITPTICEVTSYPFTPDFTKWLYSEVHLLLMKGKCNVYF